MRIGGIKSCLIWVKLWKAKFFILVWCNISGEAAGEIWNWSLLGVKVLMWYYMLWLVSRDGWIWNTTRGGWPRYLRVGIFFLLEVLSGLNLFWHATIFLVPSRRPIWETLSRGDYARWQKKGRELQVVCSIHSNIKSLRRLIFQWNTAFSIHRRRSLMVEETKH